MRRFYPFLSASPGLSPLVVVGVDETLAVTLFFCFFNRSVPCFVSFDPCDSVLSLGSLSATQILQ